MTLTTTSSRLHPAKVAACEPGFPQDSDPSTYSVGPERRSLGLCCEVSCTDPERETHCSHIVDTMR